MSERLTGAQLIADLLRNYGVSHVFFVSAILNHSLYQMELRSNITRVVTHGEKAAAYMADGYARASGRPGVCMAQMVGAANLAAGLRDGYMASSPIIAITGGPSKSSRGRHQYQEIEDDKAMFRSVAKSSVRVDSLDRLADTIRQAFRVATTGRPGPAHIEFENHWGDALELLEGDLDASAEERFSRLPPFRPAPDPEEVERAAEYLTRASRPVIVAGGGVCQSDARAELIAFAEELSIPVATSLSGKDIIPANHPLAVGTVGLYSRETANRVVAEADLAFFVGTRTGSMVTHSWRLPPQGVDVIQCDIAPDVLGVNYRNVASLMGDARRSLQHLLEAVGTVRQRTDRSAWKARCTSIVSDWYAANTSLRNSDAVPLRPERLCTELSGVLPDNAVVVTCTGHAGMWTAGMLDLRSKGHRFLRAAGSLGWAFPASLGAQCALPDRPVVCFTGDGGLFYHLGELETMARWNIPATIVVNNNNSYNQGTGLWAAAYGGKLHGRHEELWHFREVNIANVAREMGITATRVEQPAELAPALKTAIATDGPTLVEVVTDRAARAAGAYLPEWR
jgi:acetolactate synthase-1/2/3 large subunit